MDYIYGDSRKSLRVKEGRKVSWRLKEQNKEGVGRIHNISTTGMLLETHSDYAPHEHDVFSFNADLGHNNFVPENGEVIWRRKKNMAAGDYLCGIRFLSPSDYVSTKLRERIQEGLMQITHSRQRQNLISLILLGILVILAVYTFYLVANTYQDWKKTSTIMLDNSNQQAILTQSYIHLLNATELKLESVTHELETTKRLYAESEEILKSAKAELESTSAFIQQIEQMLWNAKDISIQLPEGAQASQDKKQWMVQAVGNLLARNEQLNTEMAVIKEELAFYEGNVKSTQEGKMWIDLYRTRLKDVKRRIKVFKHEALQNRKIVQREQDRIRLLLGNQGYFVKAGQVIKVDEKKYLAAELPSNASASIQKSSVVLPQETADQKSVGIDVQFVD